MSNNRSRLWVAASLSLLLSAAAVAADVAPKATPAQARHEQERAACLSGKSSQDQATCLKEADAALAAARKGELSTGDAAQANAFERCKSLPATQRSECEARMRGEGSVSGSVAGGGILRELVTPVPAASAASATR